MGEDGEVEELDELQTWRWRALNRSKLSARMSGVERSTYLGKTCWRNTGILGALLRNKIRAGRESKAGCPSDRVGHVSLRA